MKNKLVKLEVWLFLAMLSFLEDAAAQGTSAAGAKTTFLQAVGNVFEAILSDLLTLITGPLVVVAGVIGGAFIIGKWFTGHMDFSRVIIWISAIAAIVSLPQIVRWIMAAAGGGN